MRISLNYSLMFLPMTERTWSCFGVLLTERGFFRRIWFLLGQNLHAALVYGTNESIPSISRWILLQGVGNITSHA